MIGPYELGRPRARRALLSALGEAPPRLDLAALSISLLEAPELELAPVLATLDRLAERVAAQPGDDGLRKLQALRRVLADEEGFRGDEQQYFAPENSLLPSVLDRRLGLPISLSVIYLEVARRAGLMLFGVSFPGHFMVAGELGGRKVILDPFHGGQILTEQGCAALLKKVAPQVRFTPAMVSPAPVRRIVYRMLSNLKRVYLDRGDAERALRVVDLMLTVAPDHPGELRARAAILSALGACRAALEDIERCLRLSPQAPDRGALELTAQALRERVTQLN